MTDPRLSQLRIGQVARECGVSTRTLRYYEQLGLLPPSSRSAGGERRYNEADVARLHRIRELQEVLGSDLEEIRAILAAEDRLAELRAEVQAGVGRARHLELLDEATGLNTELQGRVRTKIDRLQELLGHLQERRAFYDRRRAELD